MPQENDALLTLVIHDVKSAIEPMQGKPRFDVVLAACRVAKDHFMVTDSNKQLQGVFGGLMEHFGAGSKEYRLMEAEIKALTFMDAVARGLPVDFSQMPEVPEDERSLGVSRIWRAIHKGEDLDTVRKEIEGEPAQPEKKGAPDWWKQDGPDKTWEQFCELDRAKSDTDRLCSNIEFQRNWLMKALDKLGISLPMPHPDYPEDGEMKEKGLDILVKRFVAIRTRVANRRPLTTEEYKMIGLALSRSPVPEAVDRFRADVVREVMAHVVEEFKSAAFRVVADDPAPSAEQG